MKRYLWNTFAAALLIACGLGCASGVDAYFMNTDTNANVFVTPPGGPIKKVAIMPFRASTDLIGGSISDIFVTEIMKTRRYELVERGQMAQVLNESELALAGLSAAKAVEVGNMLGADAVIIGTVDEYATTTIKGRAYPVVGISARLIECSSGKVVWSVDLAKKSEGRDSSLSLLARSAVHEMVSGVYQEWKRMKMH